MSFKNGKIYAIGHVLVPLVLTVLYFYGSREASLLVIIGLYALWSLLLIGFALSDKPFFDALGPGTWAVYSLADFALTGAAFCIPHWNITPTPVWLILFLVSLCAFELGLERSLLFCVLSVVDVYLYSQFQSSFPFFSLDTLLIVSGIIASVSFIGPTADRLNRMAFFDSLTGLPNRKMFTERLQAKLAVQDSRDKTGVLFLDVDGFKYINDTMGHHLGDHLLKAITGRMKRVLPKQAMLARMGGDEFALFMTGMKTSDDAAELAQLLLKQFAGSFSLGSQEVFATASIGIAVSPDHSLDAGTLMRNADNAMYRAKDLGRNNWQLYDPPSDKDSVERVKMETMLRHALDRGEFVVYYQPRVEIATGRMVCVEALIRWIHPEKGMISPVEFIPLAEETGLIVPIGEFVLRKVCLQRKLWTEKGLPLFRVSVNLSARQFRQTGLPEVIHEVLRVTGMDPSMLELELTESAAMQDVNFAVLMLQVLKEMGLTIAIDDFGTGYSSLSYLKKFPLDVLKIDKSFTSGIHQDPDNAAIVRAIIAMGHSLKLSITAEGVETEEQLQYLEDLGCNEIQGYYIGKPMPPDVLEQWYKLTSSKEGIVLSSA